MATSLNGFHVSLSETTFDAFVQEMPQTSGVSAFRKEHADEWFVYWREGLLFSIPRVIEPKTSMGTLRTLKCQDHDALKIISARINDCLPTKFPQYEAFRNRPFTFIGQRQQGEIVDLAVSRLRNVPTLVSLFKIRPKFELDARLIELRDGDLRIGLFLDVSTRWDIMASLEDLGNAGIELGGLHAVRRNPAPDQRRLVGRIQRVEGATVHFDEAFDNINSLPVDQVWLEGSRASFRRCLERLLGPSYVAFDRQREQEEGKLLGGAGFEAILLSSTFALYAAMRSVWSRS